MTDTKLQGLAGLTQKSSVAPTQQPSVKPTTLNEATSSSDKVGAAASQSLNEQDFLTLLVNQLENQDPLNPMDSQEFAVQLAQFSQVEQLISINKKLENGMGGTGALASMAGFLGTEVVLGGEGVDVKDGLGSNVLLNIPAGTQSARIDLVNSAGLAVGSLDVENLEAGRQVVKLENLNVPNGNYQVRVVAVDEAGRFNELSPKVTGTVEGFVLEPEPKLIIGGKEVGMDEVVEVYRGNA